MVIQGNIQIGKTVAGEIDTSSGNLQSTSFGTITLDDNVTISGNLTVSLLLWIQQRSVFKMFVFEGATMLLF